MVFVQWIIPPVHKVYRWFNKNLIVLWTVPPWIYLIIKLYTVPASCQLISCFLLNILIFQSFFANSPVCARKMAGLTYRIAPCPSFFTGNRGGKRDRRLRQSLTDYSFFILTGVSKRIERESSLVAASPNVHFLCFLDQIVPELGMRDVDQILCSLPGCAAFHHSDAVLCNNVHGVGCP